MSQTLGDLERRYPGEFLMDDRTMVCTQRVFDSLDVYEASLPTAPSIGRIYRSGMVARIVVRDPADPDFRLHVGRRLEVVG